MAQQRRISPEVLALLPSVTGKRSRTVIDHILKHGHITTDDLKDMYGYNHPPRAARDVRERGIPLETFFVAGRDGRRIAAYRFGAGTDIQSGSPGGRRVVPKALKDELLARAHSRCQICSTPYPAQYLQADHRVPYLVGGDPVAGDLNVEDFMGICASCNRAKSWSCEHCKNGTTEKSVEVCRSCYWASPENHAHVALRLIRRLDVTWTEDEVPQYDRLVRLSKHARKSLPEFVKDVIRDLVQQKDRD